MGNEGYLDSFPSIEDSSLKYWMKHPGTSDKGGGPK